MIVCKVSLLCLALEWDLMLCGSVVAVCVGVNVPGIAGLCCYVNWCVGLVLVKSVVWSVGLGALISGMLSQELDHPCTPGYSEPVLGDHCMYSEPVLRDTVCTVNLY